LARFVFHRRPSLRGCYSNPSLPATEKRASLGAFCFPPRALIERVLFESLPPRQRKARPCGRVFGLVLLSISGPPITCVCLFVWERGGFGCFAAAAPLPGDPPYPINPVNFLVSGPAYTLRLLPIS